MIISGVSCYNPPPQNNTLAIYVLKICPIWLRIQRGKDER